MITCYYLLASFPNAFTTQAAAQLHQAAAPQPAGKQTEGECQSLPFLSCLKVY